MAKNQITRKEVVEDKVLNLGQDYAKSLQPAIDANEKWVQSFAPIKEAALEYANIEKQFKVSDGRKEFLKVKQEEEVLRKKSAEAIKAEQNALISKQKVEQSLLDTQKKTIQLQSQKERQQRQSIKLTEQEKLEIRLLNRGKREAAVISSKLSTEYEKQAVILTQLRRKYKDVALTEGETSKQAKALQAQIIKLDTALKRVDANVGQFQRNVGNYTKAMQNARAAARQLASAMGLVGGAFLIVQVVRDATKVIRDFEKQNATLSAILQVEKKDMQELTDDAIRLGQTTVKTAGQVTELQIAYARLGFEQKEILDLTEATISGSIAMNSELDRTAELTGAVVNTFDELSTTDAPEILDIMSLATAKSALNFEKLETAIPIVAGAANAAGVSFTKLVALLGKLSDSGIDASSSATALRNIFIESAAQGLSYEEILEKIKGSTDKLTASNDEFGKRAAVSATVLSANIDATKELDEALQSAAGTAESMANKELDTLDGSIKLLRSAWEGYILQLNDSTDASLTLKDAIGFLATNLDKILGIIAFGAKVWLAYKAAVLLARVQQTLMNKQLSLTRLNAINSAKGINIATTSWNAFNKALKANALFLAVSALTALYFALEKLNKPLSETVSEMHEANQAFLESSQSTLKLNDNITKMADRYDELKGKSELNKKEQKELNEIIKKIAKNVPDAVTEIDKYGNALDINSGKARDFVKANNDIALQTANTQIKEQKELLSELEREQKRVNDAISKGNSVYIDGIGTIKNINGQLTRLQVTQTKNGVAVKELGTLTSEQLKTYSEYVNSIEEGIETTKKDIEANEDVVASITGVKNARQQAADAEKEQIKEAEALAEQKEQDILIVKQLKCEIASLEESLKLLTKDGYENLTKAQADNILKTREAIEAKKKELNEILGITKANKDAEKAAKEQAAKEKKLRDDAFALKNFSLTQQIEEQKAIADNQDKSFEDRKKAIQEQARLELEQARLIAAQKFDIEKELSDKEIEALLTKSKVSKETLKKTGDEELLIIEEYQAKRNEIQGRKVDSTDSIDVEQIKANVEKEKAIKEKALNDELRAENERFKATVDAYGSLEKAIEAHEIRVANIKKKYAIDALNVQVAAIEKLLENEELSAEKRAEYEAKLSELKLQISDLTTEHFITNNDKETLSEQEKAAQILDIAGALAAALTDLANSIFEARIQKIDEEIERNDEKYERWLENENLSEEQRKEIEAKQEADRKALEDKKRKEQRKQAILNKALAITDVGIATALGIMQAYAQLGPIAGSVGAVLVAALGAIQTAAIIAKPIPKYAKGTEDHPGGFALVGEERPEVISEPNKAPYVVSKPTVLDLPKKTRVTPSLDEYERLMRASILTSVEADNKRLNTFQTEKIYEKHDAELLEEMRKTRQAFEKNKTAVNVFERKIDIPHSIWASKNIKWN